MADDTSKTCIECQGTMSPIIVTHTAYGFSNMGAKQLDYRQPDDRRSFWTGKYPSAGQVHAFLCGNCGRIALYGREPAAEPETAEKPEGM